MERRASASAARPTLRTAVSIGLFVGAEVGLGLLLSGLPNVELMTLTAALAGGTLGTAAGAACGALGAIAYSLASPYGAALPPLLLAQAAGMGAAGALGGLVAPAVLAARRRGRARAAALFGGALGVTATLGYDLVTNLGLALAMGTDPLWTLAAGAPFAALHQAANLPAFVLIFPAVLPRFALLARSRLRGAEGGPGGPGAALAAAVACALWTAGAAGAFAQPPAAPPAAAAPDTASTRTAVAAPDTAIGPAVAQPDTSEAAEAAADLAPAAAKPDTIPPAVLREAAGPGPPPRGPLDPTSGIVPPIATGPVPPDGSRSLWDPFPAEVVELLDRRTALVPFVDGGLGAPARLLDEAGTSPWPQFLRDGIPLGTGHRWTDEPWLAPIAGLALLGYEPGREPWGGTEGAVRLESAEAAADRTVAETRFFKGDHETYLRSLAVRTQDAPWRLRFDFQENLDQQGYDQTPDGRFDHFSRAGESKLRIGRGTLRRQLADGTAIDLAFEPLRMHKTALPAYGVRHREIWGDHAALTWRRPTGAGDLRASLFWTQRDVEDSTTSTPPQPRRKIEARREGALVEVGGRRGWLRGTALGWRVFDSGADTLWAGEEAGPVAGAGGEAGLEAGLAWRAGPLAGEAAAAGRWARHGGWIAEARLSASAAGERPWWDLTLERGGRAPRSDELLTAERVFGGGDTVMVLLPEAGLGRESTLRAAGGLRSRWLGLDLALRGSVRRLADGIGWRPLGGGAGRWANDLELRSAEVVGSAGRRARLWGWLQLHGQLAWRRHDLRAGLPLALPPERSASLQLLWEHRFFAEDGILEIGWLLEHRGETDDPWLPGTEVRLPSLTRHDLLLGFRLVGTDLSLAVLNLRDERMPLSAGALSDARELRWRLHWTFHY